MSKNTWTLLMYKTSIFHHIFNIKQEKIAAEREEIATLLQEKIEIANKADLATAKLTKYKLVLFSENLCLFCLIYFVIFYFVNLFQTARNCDENYTKLNALKEKTGALQNNCEEFAERVCESSGNFHSILA